MWSLRGLGEQQIKILEVCRPVLLHCSLVGGKRVSPTGRHLHGLYIVDLGKVRPAVVGLGGDEHDAPMRIRFDLSGPTHLNLPGALYLTDGDPTQEYQIITSIVECSAATPTWHALTARVTGGTYTVPDHHSRIRTAGPPVPFTCAGFTGQLDHEPIPIPGDNLFFFDRNDVTVISEWWG
jgi:hypothetical protein